MITIVDFNMGNIGSIKNMCKKVGLESEITSDPQKIAQATKLILPGVGAFDKAMNNLEKLGLIDTLNDRVLKDKIPVIGICLGMQLLSKSSEEGELPGLGWIDAETIKFELGEFDLRVPHMGWNEVQKEKEHMLLNDMYKDPRFYFVHTYYIKCKEKNDILTSTNYGIKFTSAVSKENVMGVQFHPEKSHKYGMKLYENFGELEC